MNKVAAVILAAGKGTRMKSSLAKVLHPLCGEPLLSYSVSAARRVGADPIVVVLGYQSELVRKMVIDEHLVFVIQEPQLGTGHAVMQARESLSGFNGSILILCGDVPLLSEITLTSLIEKHWLGKSALTVLTTFLDKPEGYGRIIRGSGDSILKIVEERDASKQQKSIKEINTGIYCAQSDFLFAALDQIKNDNVQKEYYLTDIIAIATQAGAGSFAFSVGDFREVMGINTQEDLKQAETIMQKRQEEQKTRGARLGKS